ncbi:MAG: DUF6596 domain-containing protein [Acidimicrobiales bacterium]
MTGRPGGSAPVEHAWRAEAPRVLAAVVRRYGNFADAEAAVQEALVAAAASWPVDGTPERPGAWLVRVASRRMVDRYRADEARRRREDLAASWSAAEPDHVSGRDDTLMLMAMCCAPSLSPPAAIPLTLRAVGGLTTREIAAAFLVPEATMAQRISRAKARIRDSGIALGRPGEDAMPLDDTQISSVLHVLYLIFNEGYATSSGPELARVDLSAEAIRLARAVAEARPDDAEAVALLALMLLTDARRPARTGATGELVPLLEQDRSDWDRALVAEGLALLTGALRTGPLGEYQLQAAIAAAHDRALTPGDTDWAHIAALYERLERMTGNPAVTLNRAVAVSMVDGPDAALAMLTGVADRLEGHNRLHAVRAHLLERAGRVDEAVTEFRAAAAGALNVREQQYLTLQVARLMRRSGGDAGLQ